MVKTYVLDFFGVTVISILIVFVLVKLVIMIGMRVKGNFLDIFISSLLIYDKQSVKNTFDEDLQKYFKVSNRVNRYFYFLLLGLVLLYLLMLAI